LQDRMAASTSYAEWREFAQQVCQHGSFCTGCSISSNR
jgi:hypothetical protein